MSLKDSIMASLSASGPEGIDVPEWGCKIFLRRFPIGEWMHLLADDDENRAWSILAAAMRDENDDPVLTAAEIVALPADQTPVLLRLFREVQRINGGDNPGEA